MPISLQTARLSLAAFRGEDADDLFACITPRMTAYLPWEPPRSAHELRMQRRTLMEAADPDDVWFTVRGRRTGACLGSASFDGARTASPEVGIWLKESVHGLGYGSEAIGTLCLWIRERFQLQAVTYPVAVENTHSRRIAERLGGAVVAHRSGPKYESVVYRIPLGP